MSRKRDVAVERALVADLPPGTVVTNWVAVVTYMDPDDGAQLIQVVTPPNVLDSTLLGLLRWGEVNAEEQVRRRTWPGG
jgi:hypothetical protein